MLFKKSQTKQDRLNELEPFRSLMAGKAIRAGEYDFHFYKTHHRGGGLEIRNIETGKVYNASYAFSVDKNKCNVRLNLKSKPFNIPYHVDMDFNDLENRLKSIKVLLPILF